MIEIIAFGLSGAFAALAGIVLAARLSSGSPDLANQLLLPAMAAVVVGARQSRAASEALAAPWSAP
jgi:ribose/xylose/arabinose/galactoside ABC-type transport system permease subunit